MNLAVTFIPARVGHQDIDFTYVTGLQAKKMIGTLRQYREPKPGIFYPELGVRVDRINED